MLVLLNNPQKSEWPKAKLMCAENVRLIVRERELTDEKLAILLMKQEGRALAKRTAPPWGKSSCPRRLLRPILKLNRKLAVDPHVES